MDLIHAPNHFDRGKLFYPLVMNYLLHLVAIKDAMARGIPGADVRFHVSGQSVVNAEQHRDTKEKFDKLLGPLNLKCESDSERITVNPQILYSEAASNSIYILRSALLSAGSLLILAHELADDAGHRER